jgi:hypothetical protein
MGSYYGPAGLWVGQFTLSGCHEHVTVAADPTQVSPEISISILPPPNMSISGMQFAGAMPITGSFTGPSVTLPLGNASPSDTDINQVVNQLLEVPVLGWTPLSETFLAYPHQYIEFSSQDVFFQQDGMRTFFVSTELVQLIWVWQAVNTTSYANLYAPVSYYPANLIPAVNVPPASEQLALAAPRAAAPEVAVAAPEVSTSYIMPGGILSWGGNWIQPAPIRIYFTEFLYRPFYHPYVCNFVRALKQGGIDQLLKWPQPGDPLGPPLQLLSNDYFAGSYEPQPTVAAPYPQDNVDFNPDGAYSQYNWELFFHAPLLQATQLSQNQKFEEAQKWFHYIFDPTDLYTAPPPGASTAFPYGFWKVKPFYEQTTEQSISDLIALVDTNAPGHQAEIQSFQQQVSVSQQNPFNPFAIARLRTTAFQKATVMKYLDNLIAWGDNLFRQNTRETINEATQLYILAEQLLGPRPQQVQRDGSAPLAYKDLAPLMDSDDLSDPLVQLENALPVNAGQLVPQAPLPYAPSPLATALYFCVPPNDQLLGYWDTVADRLYKIRHCMNIEGQVEQLPLEAPPISPALLIAAAAAGVDLSTVLYGLTVPPPLYRFSYLYKQAVDFCREVHTLGAMLQSALEKDDAEALALLRATQEVSLLTQMRQAIAQRLIEAQAEVNDLQAYRKRVQDRHDWYQSQPALYDWEIVTLSLKGAAAVSQAISAALHTAAAVTYLIPEIDAGVSGFGGSPSATLHIGGVHFGSSGSAFGKAAGWIGTLLKGAADMADLVGKAQVRSAGYRREITLAQDELNEIDQNKVPIANMKLTIASDQLQDHDLKTQNAQNVAQFLQNKFTNQQLYDWMVGQISAVYFQSYQMAYQMCKRAEACYQRELAFYTTTFIQPGYWDNLHQGLLAADQLLYDVQRMQASYLDNNFREYEISRQISLETLDPVALETLKETGTCFITLPESVFDNDYPGHYLRRIKWAGVIVKLASGVNRPPNINCTLTLLKNYIRMNTDLPAGAGSYPASPDMDHDNRFLGQVSGQSIVTSNANSTSSVAADYGMFETTTHYIITDDRYLMFELAGAISSWQIELTQAANSFDLQYVQDVAIQLQYTARDGGAQLKQAAIQSLGAGGGPAQVALFRSAIDFSSAWATFIKPTGAPQPLTLALTASLFPFTTGTPSISQAILFLKLKQPGLYNNGQPLVLQFTPPGGASTAITLKTVSAPLTDNTILADATDSAAAGAALNFPLAITTPPLAGGLGTWTFTANPADVQNLPPQLQTTITPSGGAPYQWLNPAEIEDLGLLCVYTLK